jgi:uncharacterized protein (DUF488 family)
MPGLTIYTVGHSTRGWDEFVDLLRGFAVQTLVDIRSLPGSRKYPHFNSEHMRVALPESGIDYVWLKALGGRRGKGLREASPNTGLRHPSFRNYADYMLTPEFAAGVDELLSLASSSRVAIMCAEAVYWRCHRRLVSDYLVAHGHTVLHIIGPGKPRPHTLTTEAVVTAERKIVYPPPLYSSSP